MRRRIGPYEDVPRLVGCASTCCGVGNGDDAYATSTNGLAGRRERAVESADGKARGAVCVELRVDAKTNIIHCDTRRASQHLGIDTRREGVKLNVVCVVRLESAKYK